MFSINNNTDGYYIFREHKKYMYQYLLKDNTLSTTNVRKVKSLLYYNTKKDAISHLKKFKKLNPEEFI